MSTVPPSPSTETAGRRPRNFLIGCLVGCGTLALMAVGACVGFVIWVRHPAELLEPSRLVGDDTRGVVAWTLRLEDPGTRAFVETVLDTAQWEQHEVNSRLPGPLGDILGAYQNGRNRQQIERLFPVMVAWTSHGPPGAEPLDLLTVSAERLGNRVVVADWFLALTLGRSSDVTVERYRGQRIYELRQGAAFFLRAGDVLVASSADTARRAVDLLDAPEAGAGDGQVARLLERVPVETALRGAASGPEAARVLALLAGAPVPFGEGAACPQGALFEGGLTAGTAARATITLLCDDPAWAAAAGAPIAAALEQGPLASAGLDLAAEPGPDALVLRLHVENLPQLVERLLSKADAGD